ncbi:MAG: spore germination protein, partial [Clostridia bacterium]|nr:spore germination protein [Clostridia bacterium]
MKIANFFKNLLIFEPPLEKKSFDLETETSNIIYDVRCEAEKKPAPTVSSDIKENLDLIKTRFSFPKNADVIIRKLLLPGEVDAFLVFYDGMVNSQLIDASLVNPLLELSLISDNKRYDSDEVFESLIVHSQIKRSHDLDVIVDDINFGNCALFIDGIGEAYSVDVKNWPHRTVQKPENEQSIYGPQEAFAEMLRGNSAQVRKFLKTEKLICENVQVGAVSKTPGVIMYISDVANDDLVNEVRRRITSLATDYVISVEELSMMIEDSPMMITGHILATERPDRVARALSEGRVAIILNGSSRALILPTNAYEMTHSAADAYLRADFANMSRLIRLISI